jgi:2-dehydro-3-deoxygluconokinase
VKIKPKDQCRWDLVSLGEVMLRLDPGAGRIATARSFHVWEGGGEYNVARALKRCFGLDTAIVTALADNPVGRLVQDLIFQGGVDQTHLRWVPYDGIGRSVRNGLNFAERGYGVRGGLGCSDRGHTAVSQLKAGDIDWDGIFGEQGARWFHTGGIFCALSETTPAVAQEAMAAARRHGTVVSYDLNYRESLWLASGGKARAQAVNRELAPLADVIYGGTPEEFPGAEVLASTRRSVITASRHHWSAVCWANGVRHDSPLRENLEVLDRIGSGDAFAAGLAYGLLSGKGAQYGVECGAALGALTMTTPGDSATATLAEVEALMQGAGAGMAR